MRNLQRSDKSTSLFLMEMILVVFFLSVSAVVCARLYVQAHLMKEESERLTNAVMAAQNAAEAFYAAKGDAAAATALLSEDTDSEITVQYALASTDAAISGSVEILDASTQDVLYSLPLYQPISNIEQEDAK